MKAVVQGLSDTSSVRQTVFRFHRESFIGNFFWRNGTFVDSNVLQHLDESGWRDAVPLFDRRVGYIHLISSSSWYNSGLNFGYFGLSI